MNLTLRLSGVVMLAFSACAYVGIADEEAPPSQYSKWQALYKTGHVEEARKWLLHRAAVPTNIPPLKGTSSFDAEGYLGSIGNPALLNEALSYEKQVLTSKSDLDPIVNLTTQALTAITITIQNVEASEASKETRVQDLVKYYVQVRKNLLANLVSLLLKGGRTEQAAALARQYEGFLPAHGAGHDSTSNETNPAGTVQERPSSPALTQKAAGVDGVTLNVFLVLMDYYRGLALEDEAVLNRCLYTEPGFMSGRTLLDAAKKERTRLRIDRVLMPEFDNETRLQVVNRQSDVYDATIFGIVKAVVVGGKTISQRESDHFQLKRQEGRLRIMKQEKR